MPRSYTEWLVFDCHGFVDHHWAMQVQHLYLRWLVDSFLGSLQFLHQIHEEQCLSGCALWVLYPYLFESLQWHNESRCKRYENVMILSVFPRRGGIGIHATDSLFSLKESLRSYMVDVMIRAIPRIGPICALLNQFCSLLSTSTSISLRFAPWSSSDLLPLETFNKEDIFIYSSFGQKKKIVFGHQAQKKSLWMPGPIMVSREW